MTAEGSEQGSPRRHRSLWRSATDRYLGGVAGGIAERLSTDPAFVRIGLVGATLYLAYAGDRDDAQLLVLLPYAFLWACLPTPSEGALILRLRHRSARRELALAATSLGLAITLLGRPSSIVVLALGGLAVALFRDQPGPPSTTDPETIDTAPGQRWAPARPRRRQRPDRRPRPEPALWPITLGALVVTAVAALVIDQATGRLDPRIVVDSSLVAVGAVMVLSAWRGRAGITVVAVVLLVPLWVATSVPDIGRFEGQGARTFRPATLPDPASPGARPTLSYELGYGTLTVDLRGTAMPAGSEVDLDLALTAGRARITVPADVRLEVRGVIGLGWMSVDAHDHGRAESRAALDRRIVATYGALGTECDETGVSSAELEHLAARAGVGVIGPDGAPLAPEEVAAATSRAGYPRPRRLVGTNAPEDEWSWLIQVDRYFNLCKPLPPPGRPRVVRIDATVGLGTLELRRV